MHKRFFVFCIAILLCILGLSGCFEEKNKDDVEFTNQTNQDKNGWVGDGDEGVDNGDGDEGVDNQDINQNESSKNGDEDDPDSTDSEQGNNSQQSENDFFGSWYNIERQDEYWNFYNNGTVKYSSMEINDFTYEPYLYTAWSIYYLKGSEICIKDQGAPDDQPALCYDYAFSKNGTTLNFLFNDDILFTLSKESSG